MIARHPKAGGWPGSEEQLDASGSLDEVVERVADREELLLQALRIAGVGGWELDLASGTLSWSEETYRIFGVDPATERPTVDLFYSLVHPDDRARMLGEQARSSDTGEIFDEEYRIVRRDGEVRYLNSRAQVVPRGPERVNRFLGVVRDITERRLFEQQLEAERARAAKLQAELIHISRVSAMDTMASTLAHELNQPLTAITNFSAAARALRERDPLSDQLTYLCGEIEKSAQTAAEIVRRLRSMTKPETEPGDHSVIPLADCIRDAGALALLGTDARITYDIRADLRVRGDRIQLQQVIVNLVRNAFEAMEGMADKPISITARRDAASVLIGVHDEGVGIAGNVLPTIFDSFVSTKPEGMGIGLSISRTIVEAHDGQISASSTPGDGTTIWVRLPLAF